MTSACRAPAKAASAAAWLTWPPNTAGPTRRSLQAATRMSYASYARWRKFTDDGCNDECNEVVLDLMISTMMIRISSSHGLETSGMTPIDTLIPNQSTKTATKTDGKMKIGIAVHCILGCLLEYHLPVQNNGSCLRCEVKIPQMHVAQDIPRSIKRSIIRPTRVPYTSPALQQTMICDMCDISDNLQDRFSQLLTISGSFASACHSPRCWTLAVASTPRLKPGCPGCGSTPWATFPMANPSMEGRYETWGSTSGGWHDKLAKLEALFHDFSTGLTPPCFVGQLSKGTNKWKIHLPTMGKIRMW